MVGRAVIGASLVIGIIYGVPSYGAALVIRRLILR